MLGFTVKPEVNMSQIEKSRVRRCLFGPPDHDTIKKDLKKLEDQNISEMSTLYNFDFKNDVPLHGRYHWEIIASSEHIPEFYKKGYESRKTVKLNREKCSRSSISDSEDDDQGNTQHVCHQNDDEDDMDILARPLEFSSSDEEDNVISSQSTEMCNINKDTDSSECSTKSGGKVLVQRQIGDFMKKRKRNTAVHSLSSKAKLRRLDL